jgi:hypothetical protein
LLLPVVVVVLKNWLTVWAQAVEALVVIELVLACLYRQEPITQ